MIQPKAGKAKPRLILHIGMGKTGTTSIQEFCWANRQSFAAAGVHYPNLGVQSGAHHRLSPHVPLFLPKSWTFIPPDVWAPKLASGKHETILLSSEIMGSADDETAKGFAETLSAYFDVRVLIYVRRIDDSIMSTFNQNIKAGTQRQTIEDALPGMFERLRIDRVVGRWIEAFGGRDVMVRPYERAQFVGGDIFHDFCGAVGLPWSDRFVVPEGQPNARLGRSALEFKRCLNVVIPDALISAKFNPALLDYSARQDAGTKAIFQDSDLLPGAVRRSLIAQQEAYYQQLARTHPGMSGTSLFLADLPGDDLAWRPLSLSPDAFAEVGEAVLTPALKTILREQIAEARASGASQRLLYAGRFAALL